MKTTTWNPAEFVHWYLRATLEKRVRAWSDLSSRQRQLFLELDMFRRFTKIAGIKYEQYSELTLDPNSAFPPPPDLVCSGEQRPLYFELGEVVDNGVAATVARAERERWTVYGGPVDLWKPLLRILSKKLRKRYNPGATPLDLVLYYGVGRQASFWPHLAADVNIRKAWIQKRVDRGPFDAVWLYDAHGDVVLARFARASAGEPFIRQCPM